MIKFIKEVFSSNNLKKAMIYSSLSNPNITVSECLNLMSSLKEMDAEIVTEKISAKKVA